jgi:hypothetical protein
VPRDTIAYFNKNFVRGKSELLKNMNGGKTNFISAREKQMRVQIKRERDRERAISIAAQHQAIYAAERQFGVGPSSQNNYIDNVRNQHLLASRCNALSEEIRVAEQVFAAEQAPAAEQQREELQLRHLRGGAGGGVGGVMDGLSSLQRDTVESVALRHWLACNGLNQSQFPVGSLAAELHRFSEARRGPCVRLWPAANNVMNVGHEQQLLWAHQMANNIGSNNISATERQQMMVQRLRSAGLADNVNRDVTAAASGMAQHRVQEEQLLRLAAGGSSSLIPIDGSRVVDQHLLQLYLMDQQRRKDMALNRGVRQG